LIVARNQNWQCVGVECLKKENPSDRLLPSTFEIDHHVPLHKSGENEINNYKALCPGCHRLKTQLEMIDLTLVARKEKEKEKAKEGTTSKYFDPDSPFYLEPIPSFWFKE